MKNLYIIEGVDGTGKSTLSREIARQKKAAVVHCTYEPGMNVIQHHEGIWKIANQLLEWEHVVIDRWAHSELIYGTVYRKKPEYDPYVLLDITKNRKDITWIYCRNDNAIKNHDKNKKERFELYDNIAAAAEMYDRVIDEEVEKGVRPWLYYDFNLVTQQDFVKKLP